MRQCSPPTVAGLSRLSDLPTKPAWLKLAIYDAMNGKPMSLKRERRMCDALGIAAPLEPVEVDPCPDCGAVHNGGRCNGRPVTVRLVRQRQPPPAWVREAARNLERLIEAKDDEKARGIIYPK